MDGVYSYIIEPELHEFAAFVFEDICREFVREMQKKNALPFRYAKMGRWMGKTTIRDENMQNMAFVSMKQKLICLPSAGMPDSIWLRNANLKRSHFAIPNF